MILFFKWYDSARPYVINNITNPRRARIKAVFIGLRLGRENCFDGCFCSYDVLIGESLSEIKQHLNSDLNVDHWDILDPQTNKLIELNTIKKD